MFILNYNFLVLAIVIHHVEINMEGCFPQFKCLSSCQNEKRTDGDRR